MEIRIRITRMRVIIGGLLVLLFVGVLLLRFAFPGPNAVIADRNSIRGRLALPKELREFPVEQYTGRGDWYVYRYVARLRGSCDWHLQIFCVENDAEKWGRAFRGYLQMRGKYTERGGDATIAGQEHRFYLNQDSGGSAVVRLRNLSGRLQISFECRKVRKPSRIWRTRFGRYLASVFLKAGLPIDAITGAT